MSAKCVTLNLDNFENECINSSSPCPYVLTSPTSLRACSKLLIKPVELVYKCLEEYEEDLAGLPLSEIYRIYEENETERQEKLLKCRQLRRSLQLKPYEEQRQRLVQLRQIQVKPRMQMNASSSQGKNVALQNNSDTESVEGEPEENGNSNEEFMESSRVTTVPSPSTAKTRDRRLGSGSGVNTARHVTCRSEEYRRTNVRSTARSSSRQQRPQRSLPRPVPSSPYYQVVQSSKSVPNLTNQKGNLHFPKVSPTHHCHGHFHHYLCQCPNLLSQFASDKELIENYMKSYGDIILPYSASFLSSDDQKILQLMLLKKGRAMEWDRRAQELRKIIEYEKLQKNRANQLASQKWYQQLCEKRRLENAENTQRFLRLEQKTNEQNEALRMYLDNRDRKVQDYLRQIADRRNKEIMEKHKLDELKQLEVGKAIERLLEQDHEHRLALADNLQKRMTNAEIRKRRREQDYWRHICQMNRLDNEKRQLKHEQIERATQASIQQLRNQIEEKEVRSTLNYLNQVKLRHNLPKDRGRKHAESIAKAQLLHGQLLKGLDEWYKKIFQLHLAAQERASLNYRQQVSSRKEKLAMERSLREEKSLERLRKLEKEEVQKRELMKSVIESKEMKSSRHQLEKDRRVAFSRRRAQHAAELRQQLKERLDPDTFDKKVARLEIELRLMKHGAGYCSTKLKSININGNGCWFKTTSRNGKGNSAGPPHDGGGVNGKNNNGKHSLGLPPKPIYLVTNNRNLTGRVGNNNYFSTIGRHPMHQHQQTCRCGCRCRSRNICV